MLRIGILLLSAVSTYGCANNGTNEGMKPNKSDNRMPPPIEAIQSCVNQEENDVCQTKGPRGESVQGLCRTTPDNKYFACLPEKPDRPKR